MLKSVWFVLNCKRVFLKLLEMCPNSRCYCQKQNSFTTGQLQLKDRLKMLKKDFNGTEKARNKFFEPAPNIAIPHGRKWFVSNICIKKVFVWKLCNLFFKESFLSEWVKFSWMMIWQSLFQMLSKMLATLFLQKYFIKRWLTPIIKEFVKRLLFE